MHNGHSRIHVTDEKVAESASKSLRMMFALFNNGAGGDEKIPNISNTFEAENEIANGKRAIMFCRCELFDYYFPIRR